MPLPILTQAQAMVEAGRFDPALRLLADQPDTPDTLLIRAAAHIGRRDRTQAQVCLDAVFKAAPDHPQGLFLLGRLYILRNDAFSAVRVFEHLSNLVPDHPGLDEALVGAYRRDARYQDAVELADTRPITRDLLYERAMSLAHLGNGARALADFDALLSQDPNHGAAWVASHAPALELNGPDDALDRLRRAVACKGANGKYWGFLCAYLMLLGRQDEADALFHERIDGQPKRRALVDGVRAILPHLAPDFRLFGISGSVLRWAVSQAKTEGLVLEFGVRRATSTRHIAAVAGQTVHGFDSFEGLPEAWNNEHQGVMTTGSNLPPVPENVRLYAGWFEDTLGPFLAEHPGPVRLVNIDCDIYSSTCTVLTALTGRIRPGTILVFDEYIGNRHWADDEYKAFQEFVAAHDVGYRIIAVSPHTKQTVIRIERIG